MERVLLVAHPEGDGQLGRAAREALSAAMALTPADGELTVAVFGAQTSAAVAGLGGCGAQRFLVVEDSRLGQPRYATDAAAVCALVRASGAEIVVAPGTSRLSRALPGVAQRCGGSIDTRVTGLQREASGIQVERWYYRQRLVARLARARRPWFLLLAPGVAPAYEGETAPTQVERVAVELSSRTQVEGTEAPAVSAQTIRPEADLLLVAGAGWTKKQPDGSHRTDEAGKLILEFLERAQASLGSSKSLVDQAGEGESVLPFLTHLNQVGQTGTTPRHPRGLATCCHGEEPHVVGWRFIGERRAINLDPGCGWAQGKADVLYVADAFSVIARVNELLAAGGPRSG